MRGGKKERKGRQSNGPSTTARGAPSWSQSLTRGRGCDRAHGSRWTPEPAGTLGTLGGERRSAPHLGSGRTDSVVGWTLEG